MNHLATMFTQFRSSDVWKELSTRAKEIIKIKEDEYWAIENQEDSAKSRVQVQAYKEFWNEIEVLIKNLSNIKGKKNEKQTV